MNIFNVHSAARIVGRVYGLRQYDKQADKNQQPTFVK
jgi:hypothetical protein